MEKKDNPIKLIKINHTDHKKIIYEGFGPPTVFGDGATRDHRMALAAETDQTLRYFSDAFERYSNIPGVAKITLREEALAKSHRPLQLFSSTTCPIVGTLDFGELLVSATQKGLQSLKKKLLEGNSKKLVANISAIEKIEPYLPDDRLQGEHSDYQKAFEDGNQRVKLKLFDHKNAEKNSIVNSRLVEFARQNGIDLQVLRYGSQRGILATKTNKLEVIEKLSNFIGLRSVSLVPKYKALDMELQTTPVGLISQEIFPPPANDKEYPVVGVIDSGVCPHSTCIAPWVIGRETYVPVGQEDYTHGTMVAGLIINSKALNHQFNGFPESSAKILDVNVFPKGGTTSEDDLVAIIEEVVDKYQNIKVWNLSLGSSTPAHTTDFSDFAHFLDEMHDRYGCMFIVAAGNQNDRNLWPTCLKDPQQNRISSPADSVRALTVGSIAHKSSPISLVKEGEASPFSRIGPGPSFIPKPEVTHYGGNASPCGVFSQVGVLSTGPNNSLCESIGTSFSAPIVSSISAYLQHFLSDNGQKIVSPEAVKALVIHSALVSSSNVTKDTLCYQGFGKPGDIIDLLYCDSHCMTMVFETDIQHGGFEFERFPFPIPDCLNTDDGKFRGEIFMTLVYSPIVDSNYSSEYCRTNVDVGLGSYNLDGNNKRQFNSKVPAAPKDVSELFEKSRVDNGFKWSPVKAYHKASPRGIDVGDWKLKMSVLRRAEMETPDTPQRACLILSLRSLDPSQPVYNETVQKMNQLGWIAIDIDQHVRIRS